MKRPSEKCSVFCGGSYPFLRRIAPFLTAVFACLILCGNAFASAPNVVVGSVNASGTILQGSGFSVSHTGTGTYTISFSTNFGNSPIVVASDADSTNTDVPQVQSVSVGGFSLRWLSLSAALQNVQFTFYAFDPTFTPAPVSSIVTTLGGLSDVDTSAKADGDLLAYSTTAGKWVPEDSSAVSSSETVALSSADETRLDNISQSSYFLIGAILALTIAPILLMTFGKRN